MTFADLQRAVQERAAGRPVTIVGVAKKQPRAVVEAAVRAGLTVVADNYVQEGDALRAQWQGPPVAWHFVGHIQSRKAKELTEYDCVQSLDRLVVVEELAKRLFQRTTPLDVMVEVNIGREPQKSGVLPEDVEAFAAALVRFPRLRLRGLMAMPPPLEPVEQRRPFFRAVAELGARLRDRHGADQLSMGTSQDYLVAVEEGATMVRLGEVLFGARPNIPR